MKIEFTEAEYVSKLGDFKEEIRLEFEKVINKTINEYDISQEFSDVLKGSLGKIIIKHELFIF
jgi:hypothetical protein